MTHPDVNLRPHVSLPLKHLRGCVGRTPAPSGQLVIGLVEVPKPKVCNLNVLVGVQQQILCLRVKETQDFINM